MTSTDVIGCGAWLALHTMGEASSYHTHTHTLLYTLCEPRFVAKSHQSSSVLYAYHHLIQGLHAILSTVTVLRIKYRAKSSNTIPCLILATTKVQQVVPNFYTDPFHCQNGSTVGMKDMPAIFNCQKFRIATTVGSFSFFCCRLLHQ